MKKIVLTFNAILPLICLLFFSLIQKEIPWVLWLMVIPLIIPALIAFKNNPVWEKRSYWSVLLALIIVVLGLTIDLWQNLLMEGNTPDLSKHLLVLLLGLLLVASLYMHKIQFAEPFSSLNINDKISYSFKGPSLFTGLIIATIVTNIMLVLVNGSDVSIIQLLSQKFLKRGIIPPLTLLLFFWGLFLLANKWIFVQIEKSRQQNSRLQEAFTQSSNKQNFFEQTWQYFESFYVIPRYINWAIPILGFIGTVLGISLATESLASLLSTTDSNFSELLSTALSPLAIAFDTTLIALSLSVVLTLLQTLLYRWEEKHLLSFEQKNQPSE